MKAIGTIIIIFSAAVILGMLLKYLYLWLGEDISLLIMASISFIIGVMMITLFNTDDKK